MYTIVEGVPYLVREEKLIPVSLSVGQITLHPEGEKAIKRKTPLLGLCESELRAKVGDYEWGVIENDPVTET